MHQSGFLAVSEQQIRANFARYGLSDYQAVIIKVFFSDSLPDAPIEKLAILRLDGDMYSSTMDALNALYNKLSVGGFCIVDDDALSTCERAVPDFCAAHDITAPIVTIDKVAQHWRKQ